MIKKYKFVVLGIFLFLASFSILACSNPRKVSAGLDHQIKYVANMGGSGGSSNSSSITPSIYGYEKRYCDVIISSVHDGLNYCIVTDSGNYDTGITLYSSNLNGSTATSDLTVNSNNFYLDFTTAKPLYRNQYTYADYVINDLYRIEINNGAKTVWFLESKFDIESSDSYAIEKQNINGTTYTQYLDEGEFLSFQLNRYGKKALNLTDGNYTIKITRQYRWLCAKNSTMPSFYKTTTELTATLLVDSNKPSLSANGINSNQSIGNETYVNELVKYTATDSNSPSIYYKQPNRATFTKTSSTYTTEKITGWWEVYSEDKVGNKSSIHRFYYDADEPTGKILANGMELANKSYTASNFTYIANDNESGLKEIYYKSPVSNQYIPYSNGSIITPISGDGWYSFYSIDLAGNQSEIMSVYLESKIPTFKLFKNNELVFFDSLDSSKKIDSDIYLNINDSIRFEYESSSNVYLSNYSFNEEIIIDESYSDSTYEVRIESSTGNIAKYQFHVIQDKPFIKIENEYYGDDEIISFNHDIIIEVFHDTDVINYGNTGVSINSYGDVNSKTFYSYQDFKPIKLSTSAGTETTYEIVLSDRAGNEINYTIIIDKMIPHGNWISKSNILPNGGYTNSSLKFEYSDDISQALYSVDNSEYKNYNGQTFYTDGNYSILLIDLAGNKHTYTATIDSVAPKGKLYVNSKEAYSGSTVNGTVILTWDGDSTATCNGEEYEKNTAIENSGVYKFVLKDKAGNESKYSITIAGELPSITFSLIDNKLNIDIADAINGAGIKSISIYRNGITVNGTSPNITNYVFSERGVYKVIVTDQLNRTIEKRYTFEVQTNEPIPEDPSTAPESNTSHEVKVTGANNGEEVNGNVVINEIPAGSTYSLFLNGEQIEYEIGTELEEDGSYQLLVVCEDGTIVNYNFKISSDHSPNGSSIILIIIIVISIMAIIGLTIYRKKGFYKK